MPFPRFLARWVSQAEVSFPSSWPSRRSFWGWQARYREAIGEALGLSVPMGDSIVYSFIPMFPHWLLNSFFGSFCFLSLVAAVIGVWRFARGLKVLTVWGPDPKPVKGVMASIGSVLLRVVNHDRFTSCDTDHSRSISHFFVFFGFIALTVVTIMVITGPINPLIRGDFLYPFGTLEPLETPGEPRGTGGPDRGAPDDLGAALFRAPGGDQQLLRLAPGLVHFPGGSQWVRHGGPTPSSDGATRHVAYFIHLVFVFGLLVYLPYSKFAHMLYRTTAMVLAERYGREAGKGAQS